MTRPRPITAAEQAAIRQHLAIDETSPSGLRWLTRVAGGRRKLVGSLHKQPCGHQSWQVRFQGRIYRAHNLIWLLAHGEDPALRWPLTVDHLDRNGANNKVNNLRLATRTEQGRNRKVFGRSNYRFVTWYEPRNKWRAQFRHPVTKKVIFVGYFDDEFTAYKEALANRLENYDLMTGEWKART